MALVSANCPNCGASIQVNNEHESIFCMYCGSQINVQKAIQMTVKIDKSDDLANLLKIAEENLTTGQFDTAKRQIQKALEIDSCCAKAWILNMYCIAQVTYNDLDYICANLVDNNPVIDDNLKKQILQAGNNAIQNSNDSNIIEEVNSAYINIATCYCRTAKAVYCNTYWIRTRLEELVQICYPGQIAHWGQHEHEEMMAQEDAEVLFPAKKIEDIGTDCISCINKDALSTEQHAQLISLAKICMKSAELLNIRLGIYNLNLRNSELNSRKKVIRTIKSLIPNAETSINEETMSNEKQHQTNVGKLIWQIIVFIIIMIGFFFYLSM